MIPAPAEFVPNSGVPAQASQATQQAGELLLDGAVGRLIGPSLTRSAGATAAVGRRLIDEASVRFAEILSNAWQ
jgi:hypothetical protein